MARLYQVPHHAFLLLLGSALLAMLPALVNGPFWLTFVVLVMLLWRWQIQHGRWFAPGMPVRVMLIAMVLAGTLFSYGTVLGPDAGVTLLTAAFSLKLLEVLRLRDAYVVVILAFFVLATAFLLDRGLPMALYVMCVLSLLLAAMIGINQPVDSARPMHHWHRASVLLLQSLPLMLVMFVLVPRLPPLWNLPMPQQHAKTGMSDSMAPGEVSRLSQSNELAFRVEFDGPLPAPAERYWRGLTFSWFDGRRWSQAAPAERAESEYVHFPGNQQPDWYQRYTAQRGDPAWRYRVVLERTGRPWLYALAVPFVVEGSGIGVARDLRLVAGKDIEEMTQYQVESYRMAVAADSLAPWERDLNLSLPENTGREARALVKRWRQQFSDDLAFAQHLLRWFNEQPFYYTLSPPRLPMDSIDGFLFGTRRGFCEHYASSYAFMLRAAGIPARIVAGYQGGEENSLGDHIRVRQRDAHVWVEAWLPGLGWREFDPTAAVAPSRIEYGIDRALAELSGSGSLIDDFAGNISVLVRMGHLADYIEFAWAKWVLGYDQQSQLQFLGRWLGQLSPIRIAMFLAISAGMVMLILAAWIVLQTRNPPLPWWQREYMRLFTLLRRKGVPINDASTPADMAATASHQYPRCAEPVKQWQQLYQRVAYSGAAPAAEDRARLVMLRREITRYMRR